MCDNKILKQKFLKEINKLSHLRKLNILTWCNTLTINKIDYNITNIQKLLDDNIIKYKDLFEIIEFNREDEKSCIFGNLLQNREITNKYLYKIIKDKRFPFDILNKYLLNSDLNPYTCIEELLLNSNYFGTEIIDYIFTHENFSMKYVVTCKDCCGYFPPVEHIPKKYIKKMQLYMLKNIETLFILYRVGEWYQQIIYEIKDIKFIKQVFKSPNLTEKIFNKMLIPMKNTYYNRFSSLFAFNNKNDKEMIKLIISHKYFNKIYLTQLYSFINDGTDYCYCKQSPLFWIYNHNNLKLIDYIENILKVNYNDLCVRDVIHLICLNKINIVKKILNSKKLSKKKFRNIFKYNENTNDIYDIFKDNENIEIIKILISHIYFDINLITEKVEAYSMLTWLYINNNIDLIYHLKYINKKNEMTIIQ